VLDIIINNDSRIFAKHSLQNAHFNAEEGSAPEWNLNPPVAQPWDNRDWSVESIARGVNVINNKIKVEK
jgi:hypothetical protein